MASPQPPSAKLPDFDGPWSITLPKDRQTTIYINTTTPGISAKWDCYEVAPPPPGPNDSGNAGPNPLNCNLNVAGPHSHWKTVIALAVVLGILGAVLLGLLVMMALKMMKRKKKLREERRANPV